MQALAGDNSPAFINKTLQNALDAANMTAQDLAKVKREKGLFGKCKILELEFGCRFQTCLAVKSCCLSAPALCPFHAYKL